MAVALSYFISRVVKGNQTLGLILAGIAIGSLFNAFLSLMKYAADTTDQLPTITYWLMGSLNAVDRQDILVTGLPMLAGITILMLMRWRLNVLAMGEEEAMALASYRSAAWCSGSLLHSHHRFGSLYQWHHRLGRTGDSAYRADGGRALPP